MAQRKLKRRTKQVSLAFMGEEWNDGYIESYYLNYEDAKAIQQRILKLKSEEEAVDEILATLKQTFVSGKGINEQGELVDMTAADLEQIDFEAQRTLYERVLGVPDPKA
jgi:hypothetical protein